MTTWLDRVAKGGRIKTTDLNWHALEFLAYSLRAIDRAEIFGNLATDNPLEFAAQVFQATAREGKGFGWLGWLDGRPAGALCLIENFPGNWQVASFGTGDYNRVAALFKAKLDDGITAARAKGMHRLECKSLASHGEAHRLLRAIGFTLEVRLCQYGKHGEDYLQFARTFPLMNRE